MITPKKSRKAIRVAKQQAEQKSFARKAAAASLITLMGASLVATPSFAATTGSGEVSLRWDGNGDKAYSISGGLTATESETKKLAESAEGYMRGTVKLSASATQLKALADKGIIIDLDSSEQITNKLLAKFDPTSQNEYLHLDVKFDETKLAASAKDNGFENWKTTVGKDGLIEKSAYLSFLREDQRAVSGNIAPNSMWSAPKVVAGDQLANQGGLAFASSVDYLGLGESAFDYNKTVGAFAAASLNPVVSIVNGGEASSRGGSPETTTLVDPYSNGDDSARQKEIASVSKRGMPTDIANCLVDNCGIWVTPIINENGTNIALSAPIRIHVETTVSAGKAPTGTTTTLASGDKVQFVPEQGFGYFGATKVGEWLNAAIHNSNVRALSESTVELQGITYDSKNGSLSVDTGSTIGDVTATVGLNDSKQDILKVTSTLSKVDNWEFEGKNLVVGQKLAFNGFTATVASINGNTVDFRLSSTNPAFLNADKVTISGIDLTDGVATIQTKTRRDLMLDESGYTSDFSDIVLFADKDVNEWIWNGSVLKEGDTIKQGDYTLTVESLGSKSIYLLASTKHGDAASIESLSFDGKTLTSSTVGKHEITGTITEDGGYRLTGGVDADGNFNEFSEWLWNGAAIAAGDTLTIDGMDFTVEDGTDEWGATDGSIVLVPATVSATPDIDVVSTVLSPSFPERVHTNINAPAQTSVDNVQIATKLSVVLGGASMDATPTYTLKWTKAEEPEKTPEIPETPTTVLPTPKAIADTGTGKYGEAVTINLMANDTISKGFRLVEGSVHLVDPSTKKNVDTVSIAKQGTYKVNADDSATFTPVEGFVGKASALTYTWKETNGTVTQSAFATVQATIAPLKDKPVDSELPKPVAMPDHGTAKFGQPVILDVLANDEASSKAFTIQKETVRLIDPTSNEKVMQYTVKGQGTYVANANEVTFTPERGFDGDAEALGYTWDETNGTVIQTASSTVSASIEPATDETGDGGGDEPEEEIGNAGAQALTPFIGGGLVAGFVGLSAFLSNLFAGRRKKA